MFTHKAQSRSSMKRSWALTLLSLVLLMRYSWLTPLTPSALRKAAQSRWLTRPGPASADCIAKSHIYSGCERWWDSSTHSLGNDVFPCDGFSLQPAPFWFSPSACHQPASFGCAGGIWANVKWTIKKRSKQGWILLPWSFLLECQTSDFFAYIKWSALCKCRSFPQVFF